MAKLAEQFIILKVSKAVASSANDELEVLSDEMAGNIIELVQELLTNTSDGAGCIVDIERSE